MKAFKMSLIAAAMLVSASVVAAQPRGGAHPRPSGERTSLTKALELDEAQSTKYESAQKSQNEALAKLSESTREKIAKIQEAAKKEADKIKANTQSSVDKILTDEQKAKLEELKSKRAEMAKKHDDRRPQRGKAPQMKRRPQQGCCPQAMQMPQMMQMMRMMQFMQHSMPHHTMQRGGAPKQMHRMPQRPPVEKKSETKK